MRAEQIFQIVCLVITVCGLTVACLYLTKAGMYQRSTSAYWDAVGFYQRGQDVEAKEAHDRGDRLQAKAERFARWLPR